MKMLLGTLFLKVCYCDGLSLIGGVVSASCYDNINSYVGYEKN